MLKSKYGKIKIKKGSILYQISDEEIRYTNTQEQPLIYCLFHPSEDYTSEKYVSFIKIKKTLSLLFMIKDIKRVCIETAFNDITGLDSLNYAKKNSNQMIDLIDKLKNEKLDGWITSINDRLKIELAIINNVDNYKIIKTKIAKRYWSSGYYKNNEYIPKIYGFQYPICSIYKPIKFRLNKKYKKIIEKYVRIKIYCNEYTFKFILKNANIKYYNFIE
jgi:hypothetical protein